MRRLINISFDRADFTPEEYPTFYSNTSLCLEDIEWEGEQLPQKGDVITGLHTLIPDNIWNTLPVGERESLSFTSENGMVCTETVWDISEDKHVSYCLLLCKRLAEGEDGKLILNRHE